MEYSTDEEVLDLLTAIHQDEEAEIEEIEEILDLMSDGTLTSSSEESDSELIEHPKCANFVNTIGAFSESIFKSHMRLKRSTVEYLISRFSQSSSLLEESFAGRPKISCRLLVYMYIWYVSNTITYRQLGNLFGVTKSSAWKAVRTITSWLITIGHEYVKWPEGANAHQTCQKFETKKRIPGIIGAIDCTHVNIKAPKVSKECYFDRKQNYSLVLQAVVDADKKFTHISCGEPGSLHDSRVLRRSDLFIKAETNYAEMFPNNSFIIGDSAYFSTIWLVPPFKDNGNLTVAQRKFNEIHSSTRMVVENAFGLLKGRFRRLLKFTEHTDLCAVTNLIVSICILHNICIIKDDLCEDSEPTEPQYDMPAERFTEEQISDRRTNRREILFNYLLEQNIIQH